MKDEKLQNTIFIQEEHISSFFYFKFKESQIEQKYVEYNSKWMVKLRKIIAGLSLFYSCCNCYFLYSRLANIYLLYSSISFIVIDSLLFGVLIYLSCRGIKDYVLSINFIKFVLTFIYFLSVMIVYAYFSIKRENTTCEVVSSSFCSNFFESIIRNFYLQAVLIGIKYFLYMKPSKFCSVLITLIYFIYFACITIFLGRPFLTYISELSSCVLCLFISVVSSEDVQKFFRETFIYNQRVNTMFNYFKNFINDLNHQYVSLFEKDVLIYNNAFFGSLNETLSKSINKCENHELITQPNHLDFSVITYETVMSYFENFSLYMNSELNLKMVIFNEFNYETGKNKLKDTSNHFVKLGVFQDKSRGCIYSVSYRYFYLTECNGIFDIILEDITQIKSAEKIEIETKIKQKLLSKVAHEFKTPLLTIINMVQELKSDIETRDFRNIELLSTQVCNVSEYVLFQINDIIYYSNQESMKFHLEEVNVLRIIEFCEGVLQALLASGTGNKKNIQVNLAYDKGINNLKVYSDEYRLKQILLNLISNAVKFTKYGEISIRADYFEDKCISIKISDTGVGLSEADIQKIKASEEKPISINVEESYNHMGTGLGLGIAQTMIKKLGHGFEVESELQKGSTFEIRIYEASIIHKCKSSFKTIEPNASESVTAVYKGYSSNFLFNPNSNIQDLSLEMDLHFLGYEDKLFMSDRRTSIINGDINHVDQQIHKVGCKNHCGRDSGSLDEGYLMKTHGRNNIAHHHKKKNSRQLSLSYSSKSHILIIDDSLSIRNSTVNLIKKSKEFLNDFHIVQGNDGIETLNNVMHDQYDGCKIKIIISDENMEFMNGSESFRILRELEKSKKVKKIFLVCLTAFSDDHTLDRIKQLGADLVVCKPLTLQSLNNVFREYTDYKAKYNLN